MKKMLIFVNLLLLFVLASPALHAEEEEISVKDGMQVILKMLKGANADVANGDFYNAGVKMMEFAEEFKELDMVEPTKGKKSQWDQIHKDINFLKLSTEKRFDFYPNPEI